MTTTATPGLVERLTKPITNLSLRSEREVFDIMCDRIRHALATPSPTPAGGEVRALREALEPFADAVHGLSDRVADDAAILLTIDGPVVTFAWVKAGDFRRAGKAFAAPAEAAQAGEDWRDDPSADERWNTGLDYAMEHLCKLLGVDRGAVTWDAATETLDGDVMAVLGNIMRAKYGEDWGPQDATPSREEVPTDEQVERAARALATLHYTKRFAKPPYDGHVRTNVDGNWHTYSDEARAALKAAGPSAQQRVSEANVWQSMDSAPTDGKHILLCIKNGPFFRAVEGACYNGKWAAAFINADDLKPVYWAWKPTGFVLPEAALSPENGGA